MRALLVAAAPVEGSLDLVAAFAAKSDLVIAVDAGGMVCLDAGIVPDVVLGDFDSLSVVALNRLTAKGARAVAFPSDKNETDLELALDEARRCGVGNIVVTCATSGRLDHTLAVLGALAGNADLRPELAEPTLSGWVLSPRGRRTLLVGGLGDTLSLLAMTDPAIVSATGVQWPLDDCELPFCTGLGVSNVITTPAGATITVRKGTLLVLGPPLLADPRQQDGDCVSAGV